MAEALPNPFIKALAAESRKLGLIYSTDTAPGIVRRRSGKHFTYFRSRGARIKDSPTLLRIKRLAIPPAWTEVWICPDERGHIQATGRDARGRKQYRYHSHWRQERDTNKFARLLAFARALPRIRRRVKRDLALTGMPREKVLATVVRLLETTLIRIGNDEYARHNDSYGLTTMRNRHARANSSQVHFTFKGKSGRKHEISVRDPQLARIVRRCQNMPGQELFAYEDADGKTHDVRSQDVNEYLREISGDDFTAKDFRTWAGTVFASVALREFSPAKTVTEARKNVVGAIAAVAKLLGNTTAVCRKCYIHPKLLDSYISGKMFVRSKQRKPRSFANSAPKLKPDEVEVFAFLARTQRANGKISSKVRAARSTTQGKRTPKSRRITIGVGSTRA
jgi:DNA topoisomerase I